MQAISAAIANGGLKARIAIVLSDNPDAYILERARQQGIPAEVIDCDGYLSKFPEVAQAETARKLKELQVDLVCLAGFMRLVKAPLLDEFPSRILNIHPSLLPAFPGIAAWQQAIRAGVKEAGVTVHLVDSGMDTGEILLQQAIPVNPNETPETLHRRLQLIEHTLYPTAISNHAKTLGL